jgi:hypothetical protein
VVNRVAAASATNETGFLTFITGGQEFVGTSGVLIESVVETDGRPVGDSKLIRPFVGAKIAAGPHSRWQSRHHCLRVPG